MEKEKRIANVMFQENGNGYRTTKMVIPVPWIDALGFTKEDREAEIEFDGEKIIIKKTTQK